MADEPPEALEGCALHKWFDLLPGPSEGLEASESFRHEARPDQAQNSLRRRFWHATAWPVAPYLCLRLVLWRSCARFGHASFIGIDLLKFQVGSYSALDKIDVGVYVVTTSDFQRAMKAMYSQKWRAPLTFEKVKRYLPHFKSSIQVPIYVLGIDLQLSNAAIAAFQDIESRKRQTGEV